METLQTDPFHSPQILRTKIRPPQISDRVMPRTRISRALSQAPQHRLTVIQAGAGYGKSTALASFAHENGPVIWYQVSAEDNDPLVFLLYLSHAAHLALPGLPGLPLAILEAWDGTRGPLPSREIVHRFLNVLAENLDGPTYLVIDDVHLVEETTEICHILDWLIAGAPPDLHVLLASRMRLTLPSFSSWRAKGEILNIDQTELVFTCEEIAQLFNQQFGYELATDEVEALFDATEGWAITLQLIWQSLRSGAHASIEEALKQQHASLDSLFEVLAVEVLGKQPKDVQDFLKVTATLRVMTPEACDALRGATDSDGMLAYLLREELFVVNDADVAGAQGLGSLQLRYQHVFHRFLCQRSGDREAQKSRHRRAAQYYRRQNDPDSTIYHLLQAWDYLATAEVLADYGRQLIAIGRLDTLSAYLDELPPETFHARPILLAYLGDLARLRSRFQESLDCYHQAEALWRERGHREGLGRALRGQARVYLDTVNPKKAEELLQRALRLSDGAEDLEAQARLYELLAENKLNAGKLEEAERLRGQAAALREEGPDESQLLFRVLLRTGRIEEARQRLEEKAQVERDRPVRTPRAHRETQLLLSIIYAFSGDGAAAYQAAVEGTQRGEDFGSPFITAVGHMRQGHALMLLPGDRRFQHACQQFERAIELSRTLATPRLRIEAYWGLCRAYGYQGDLVRAGQMAERGLELALQVGDEWIGSVIRVSMSASLILAGRYEAANQWAGQAIRGFQECSDPFGENVARLWLCYVHFQKKEHTRLAQQLPSVLQTCREGNYDFLFERPTVLGPPDERIFVPMLILARQEGWEPEYASHLLRSLDLPEIKLHPGYQLRVLSLGEFLTFRGREPISSAGWLRTNARQLFQLLITFHHTPLDREQIFEHLWPGGDPQVATRNFKTALNTLYRVLEPQRARGAESAFIHRDGTRYQFRPEADLWFDAQLFAEAVQRAEAGQKDEPGSGFAELERAVEMYKGDYLPDIPYETWAAAERERLAVLFLRAADRLCGHYVQTHRLEEVVELSHRMLAQDNCWERAYRYLMKAYDGLGDHGQIARSYQQCVQTLAQELGVQPAKQTTELFKRLTIDT